MEPQPQPVTFDESLFRFELFSNQQELEWMMRIIRAELAEPYSIFTYNYFLTLYAQNTIMAYYGQQIIGCIIGMSGVTQPSARRANPTSPCWWSRKTSGGTKSAGDSSRSS